MEPMTKRTEQTITHLNSLNRIDYTDEEFYLIVLNAIEEYVPQNIVNCYEDLI